MAMARARTHGVGSVVVGAFPEFVFLTTGTFGKRFFGH